MEYNSAIQAIITDLDGTILPRNRTISPETVRSLHQIGSKGITRIIATGRSLFAVQKVLPADFPIDYLVFSSGAGILKWSNQQLLSATHLNIGQVREIADYLWQHNMNFIIQKEIPENHYFYYTEIYPVHPDYRQRVELYRDFGTRIENHTEIRSDATEIIVILSAPQLRQIEQLRADLPGYSIIRSTSPIDNKAIWLEIFPKNINKGSSCTRLLNQLQISGNACAGLGNDYNDIDFLDICGKAFLVANAPSRLKPLYKTVASDLKNGFSEFISISIVN